MLFFFIKDFNLWIRKTAILAVKQKKVTFVRATVVLVKSHIWPADHMFNMPRLDYSTAEIR